MVEVSSRLVFAAKLMGISGLVIHSVSMSKKKNQAKCAIHKHVKVTGKIDIFDTVHSQDKAIAQSEMLFLSSL